VRKQRESAEGEARRRRPQLTVIVACLLLAAGCADASAGAPGTQTPTAAESVPDGPLEFPDGFMMKMAPVSGASYAVFEACSTTGDIDVRLVSVSGGSVTGTDDVDFHAVWPRPKGRPLPGGGEVPLPDAYEPAAGSTGTVRSCSNPPAGLEIAAVFPPAVLEDVEVDRVTLVYETGGRQFTETANVTLGICASEPVDSPTEYCG
jgi:hypothetical protein